MSSDLQQQFVRDMLTESLEGLDRFDRAILLMEKGEAAAETLNDIFRVIHTLKGTAGCLGFQVVEKIAHAGENVLHPVRSGTLAAGPAVAAGMLKLSDALRTLLAKIEAHGHDRADIDFASLLHDLQEIRAGRPPASVRLPESSSIAAAATAPAPAMEARVAPAELPAAAEAPVVDAPANPAVDAAWGLFGDDPAPTPATAPAAAAPVAEPAASAAPAKSAAPAAPANSLVPQSVIAGATVRVDVAVLDRLMNLVGELVLSRNQLVQLAQSRHLEPDAVAAVSQRLNLVTTELQEGVMKTRMQPIGNLWAKFPRIVRDISHELGKQVRLETIGATTELDRTVLESIRDPLTHIIRNSIDHGIESPAARTAKGKPAEGSIVMRAFHEGGQVNIEILDDGAGINLPRVRQKAVDQRLITPDEAARLSDREIVALIFQPGFSTAEKVTNVSGRGVGMDVVKTNIEKIGGSVDIHSESGQGTAIRIKIPLTLAIVPALIVCSAGERFAIPQVSLLELVRMEAAQAATAIEKVYDTPVFRLRGQLLPLVFLDRELKLRTEFGTAEILYIVVLQADQRTFGLVVDEVVDTEEIVVKPLGKHLKGLPMFAGATIMGDGRVALILDVLGLAQHSRVVSENRDRGLAGAASAAGAEGGPRSQLLLFSLPGRERLALPLEQAARLEEIPLERVETSGSREAVQYRGGIMPLVRLAQHLPGVSAARGGATGGPLQVIVYAEDHRRVGLVVGEIRDIVEDVIELQPGTAAPGIKGSAIVLGRITDLVDVEGVLRHAGLTANRAA